MSHIRNSRLIYANFSNDVSIRPYAVFYDTAKQCLVITIRGTLSLEDCITDATAEPKSLVESGMFPAL